MNKASKRRKRIAKLESLKQINVDAAGIDIGSVNRYPATTEPYRSFF